MHTIAQLMSFQPKTTRTFDVFLLELTENLLERGWRSVYVFSGEPEEQFARRLRDLEAVYYLSSFPLQWGPAFKLARQLRIHRPDVMQTTFMSAFDAPLWWLKLSIGAKRWVFADQTSGAGSEKFGLKRLVAKARGGLASLIIDEIIAVSGFVATRDVERNMLPRRKIRTIYNGTDLDRFHPGIGRTSVGDPFVIAFVGQLIPEKGVDLLFEAIRRLENFERSRVLVKVAGAGRMRDELMRIASRDLPGQVEFLGQVDDVPSLFRSADLAVFPSRWEEAFGLVTTEAMACGTPVITSDAGGFPELVGRDGRTGLTFRNGDAEALSGHIRALLVDPDRFAAMGLAGREVAIKEFSLKRMVNDYISVYEQLICG